MKKKNDKKDLTKKDWKILSAKSGNRCALPDCRAKLVAERTASDKAAFVAVAAHIKGENPGSARYDAEMSDADRESVDNRILVCPSCHTKIDAQLNSYSVETLLKYRSEHEEWVAGCVQDEVSNISFSELDVVTKHLISNPGVVSESLTLLPPKEKINKNGLSGAIEKMILVGMTQTGQVSKYVEDMAAIDAGFVDRLVGGFVSEYQRLFAAGIRGDQLFEELMEFSCASASDFKQRAAGLSVLVYLFERCDVFEK